MLTAIARPIALITGLFLGLVSAGQADVAEYRVTFDATWSSSTHPTAYPTGAHFSGMVGGTHDTRVSFWDLGGVATFGIERMAEGGATAPLLAEVSTAMNAGTAYSQVLSGGLNSPGVRQTTFSMQPTHPRVTVVTMIAPSPDWFVGVSGLVLHDGNAWLDNVVVSLDPHDAGTDSATNFADLDEDTDPQDPISLFSGPPFAGTPPLGTFTFEILNIITACNDGIDNDGDQGIDLADAGCDDASDDTETSPALACDDGLDTDGDTFVDGLDPGCDDPLDPSELSNRECDDGIDNDGDLAIDYPNDPDCTSPLDLQELLSIPMTTPLGGWLLIMAIGGAGVRRVLRQRA